MRFRRAAWLVGGGLMICSACSLRSLDHLRNDAAEGEGGEDSGGHGATGSQGATGGQGAASPAGGSDSGASATGGTASGGSAGSSVAGMDNAGAGGMPPEVPDCDDQEQTVDETDVDCGGRTCAPCADEKRCITGTDCASAICTNQVCQPPSCSDLAVNGSETDLNCGGSCPECEEGRHCRVDEDCKTGACGDGMCFSPQCNGDVLQNGCPLLVDNTPYSLSPAHAPTKCVDDNGQSVAEGNGMVLYSCKMELHQTFWTVAREDGHFAFRNALSGKCLRVRNDSTAANAVIEQSACDYSPSQLWKPARVDDTYMTLRSKLSGLVLDVAGSNVSTDAQAICQGADSGSNDTRWQLKKRSQAAYIGLATNDDKSLLIRHDKSDVTVSSRGTSASASWRVMPGLSDPSLVSFEARDDPGRYLRHGAYQLWSDKSDGSTLFKKDATFRYVSPFVGTSPLARGLESSNYAGHFLKREGDVVKLTTKADTSEFRSAATWWISPR